MILVDWLPHYMRVARDLLGHASLHTTNAYYNQALSIGNSIASNILQSNMVLCHTLLTGLGRGTNRRLYHDTDRPTIRGETVRALLHDYAEPPARLTGRSMTLIIQPGLPTSAIA
jgi:hypothetical protein